MPRSKQEKDEIRQRSEARRQQDKDRTGHEQQRGRKLLTLADLSRQKPTSEQLENYEYLIMQESDRGSAIMAGALVEESLTIAIRAFIVDPGETTAKTWFDSPSAPFGNFAAKIKLGRALAIYGENLETRLNLIKDIRNAFAHSSIPLDFEHPTLAAACVHLNADPEKFKDKHARILFWSYCLAVSKVLVNLAFSHGGKEIDVHIQ